MAATEYLKTKNIPYVTIYVVWCLALYIVFLSSPMDFWNNLESTFQRLTTKNVILTSLLPIIIFVLTGLLSSANKARLVFWRFRDALPGHRAFSELACKDPRIDMEILKNRMNSLHDNPKKQNALWYSVYKRYSEAITVKEAHRSFLLFRDLCSIAFLFSLIGVWGIYMFQDTRKAMIYFSLMFLQYIILALVARNHGNRFVCNVLAEYISDTKAS